MLDAQVKKDWLKALRSGNYTQGRLCLRAQQKDSPDKFCCLGVLLDLIHPENWAKAPDGYGEYSHRNTSIGSRMSCPSQNFAASIGINLSKAEKDEVDIASFSVMDHLINMNDGASVPRASFVEIAAWIETHL